MTERIYDKGQLSATRLDDGTYTIRHKHLGSLRLGADYLPAIAAVAADCGDFIPKASGEAELLQDYEFSTKVNMELKGEVLEMGKVVSAAATTISNLQDEVLNLKVALEEEAAQVAVLTATSIDLPPGVQLEVTNEVSVEEIPKASTPSSSDPSTGSDGG